MCAGAKSYNLSIKDLEKVTYFQGLFALLGGLYQVINHIKSEIFQLYYVQIEAINIKNSFAKIHF